jgi:hypothetical protein
METPYPEVQEPDFAIPSERKYPMDNPERARAALRYWGMPKNKAEYSEEEQKTITARMHTLAQKQGVDADSEFSAAFSVDIPVEFVDAGVSGYDDIPYTGKLFNLGTFEDKDFSLGADECDIAIKAFTQPVNADYEHNKGFLDGKLGQLIKVWRQNENILGTMLIPKQLRELAGPSLQASLTWDRATKTISGLALTNNPRISDATLTAAFTLPPQVGELHHKEHTSMTLKEQFLALFTGGKTPEDLSEAELAQFVAPTDAEAKAKAKKDAEDAETAAQEAADAKKKKAEEDAKAKMTATVVPTPVEDRMITGLKAKQVKSEATALFTSAIAAGKVTPAQSDAFIAAFTALHKADNAGIVTFTADGDLRNGDGVKALVDFVNALPANPALFAERLENEARDGKLVSFGAQPTGTPSAERMSTLRKHANLKA